MHTANNLDAMIRDLQENGFDAEQGERYDFAFDATKKAVLALLCARYGAGEQEMLEALMDSRNLATEASRLIARMEVSSEFVGFIHSARRF